MTSENAAPAEMPGVEEIAKLISGAPFPSAKSLAKARAVLALFAPILAERERLDFEATRLAIEADRNEVGWNAAEARALSAKAALAELRKQMLADEGQHREALASERGRCIAIVDAQVPDWVKERSGPYWEGYRDAMEDAAEDMRKGSPPRAAAIRAEGE